MIKNLKELSISPERELILSFLDQALENLQLENFLSQKIFKKNSTLFIEKEKIDLSLFKRIFLLGIGKGSAKVIKFLESILEKEITQGFCIDIYPESFKKTWQIIGTHPVPSEKNFQFTKKVVEIFSHLEETDLVITAICGGGSAMFVYPESEYQQAPKIFKLLTQKSADIYELNTVRKHISLVKGGGLAKIIYPAQLISLIISDVPGNDLSIIASGPTVSDQSTIDSAKAVLEKYQIEEQVYLFETPKEKKYFQNVKNFLIMTNQDFLLELKKLAIYQKIPGRIFKDDFQAEVQTASELLIKEVQKGELLLVGGETTVEIKGSGKGGRNQELVLWALKKIKETNKDILFISFASDGLDNTESAGAVGDKLTLQKAEKLNLKIEDYLKNNDSFNFFAQTKDLIFTGFTGFNLSDIILVYYPKTSK